MKSTLKYGLIGGLLLAGFLGCVDAALNAVQPALTDIEGWNVTACAHDMSSFKTCYDFFMDNRDRILGGSPTVQAIMDDLQISESQPS